MKKRVVIAGGGFAGLRTARLLARRLKNKLDIVLVDQNERFVFSPWLIDGLAGTRPLEDLSEPYDAVARREGFSFVRGEFLDAKHDVKILEIRQADGQIMSIAFDVLVMCPGAHIAYYGIPGADKHTFPLKILDDLPRLHAGLQKLANQARVADETARADLLHIVIVGGGPSGIEALFAIQQYVKDELLGDAPQLKKHLRFTLLNAAPDILSGFRASLVAGSRRAIARQGVEVLNGDPAVLIEPGKVITKSGIVLKTGFVLWCAGVQPNEIPVTPDIPRDAKRCPQPDATLRLDADLFAAGDAIICEEEGKPAPRTAQVAMHQAIYIAKNVELLLNGQMPKPYRHKFRGSLITLGDTGYLDTPMFSVRTPLAIVLRSLFYHYRFWQMTGRWV